jgi:hypothetical protein
LTFGNSVTVWPGAQRKDCKRRFFTNLEASEPWSLCGGHHRRSTHLQECKVASLQIPKPVSRGACATVIEGLLIFFGMVTGCISHIIKYILLLAFTVPFSFIRMTSLGRSRNEVALVTDLVAPVCTVLPFQACRIHNRQIFGWLLLTAFASSAKSNGCTPITSTSTLQAVVSAGQARKDVEICFVVTKYRRCALSEPKICSFRSHVTGCLCWLPIEVPLALTLAPAGLGLWKICHP